MLQEKQLQKNHPSTSLLLGWTHISPPVSGGPECPTPFLGRDLSLPLKSCSYCSSDRRCFTTLSWGQTIFISHQVKQPLSERGHLWISDQRILRYQVVLMENLGLTVSLCEVLNPATLLPTPDGSLPFHSCLETLDHRTKSQEGLSEDPLTNHEEIWYTDGSSFVLDGKRRAGWKKRPTN